MKSLPAFFPVGQISAFPWPHTHFIPGTASGIFTKPVGAGCYRNTQTCISHVTLPTHRLEVNVFRCCYHRHGTDEETGVQRFEQLVGGHAADVHAQRQFDISTLEAASQRVQKLMQEQKG